MTDAVPLNVFISYSHKDEDLKEELEVHLANLIRQKKINPWQDRALEAGTEWDAEIKAQLNAAHIILLLITPRFMASGYINDIELAHAMERHQRGTARVIPIILKPTDWTGTTFSKLQVLPKDAKPVTTWDNQDAAFLNVVEGLRRTVDAFASSILHSSDSNSLHHASDDSLSRVSPPVMLDISSSQVAEPSAPQVAEPSAPQVQVDGLDPIEQERLELYQSLLNLSEPDFKAVLYTIKAPPPVVLASQLQRIHALLLWAKSPMGCGLDKLEAVINAVSNSAS